MELVLPHILHHWVHYIVHCLPYLFLEHNDYPLFCLNHFCFSCLLEIIIGVKYYGCQLFCCVFIVSSIQHQTPSYFVFDVRSRNLASYLMLIGVYLQVAFRGDLRPSIYSLDRVIIISIRVNLISYWIIGWTERELDRTRVGILRMKFSKGG